MIIDTHVHISHNSFDNSFPFLRAGLNGTELCAEITRLKLIEELKKWYQRLHRTSHINRVKCWCIGVM